MVNNGCQSAILSLIKLKFFKAYSLLKLYILFHSNGLAILHGLPDIKHITVNFIRKSAILNLTDLKFFRAHRSLKPPILLYSNGLAM